VDVGDDNGDGGSTLSVTLTGEVALVLLLLLLLLMLLVAMMDGLCVPLFSLADGDDDDDEDDDELTIDFGDTSLDFVTEVGREEDSVDFVTDLGAAGAGAFTKVDLFPIEAGAVATVAILFDSLWLELSSVRTLFAMVVLIGSVVEKTQI